MVSAWGAAAGRWLIGRAAGLVAVQTASEHRLAGVVIGPLSTVVRCPRVVIRYLCRQPVDRLVAPMTDVVTGMNGLAGPSRAHADRIGCGVVPSDKRRAPDHGCGQAGDNHQSAHRMDRMLAVNTTNRPRNTAFGNGRPEHGGAPPG